MRVEDLVFVLLAGICTRAACVGGLLPLARPAAPSIAVLAVAGTGAIAAVMAASLGTVPLATALLYAVRPLEYWIVFPSVRLLLDSGERAARRRIDLLLASTTVLQSAFAAAQYFLSWDVGFSHAAYTRAAGLTVGPYELGAIGAALTVYWLSRRRFALTAVAALALVVSLSRISIVGAALGVALFAVSAVTARLRNRRRRAVRPSRTPLIERLARGGRGVMIRAAVGAGAAALVLGVALGYAASPVGGTVVAQAVGPLTERFSTTSVLGSWNAAAGLAERIPALRTSADYQDLAYARLADHVNTGVAAASGAEPSNLIRFFRWRVILDTIDEPREVLLGLGPSFVGPSVDGSYLRSFADAGLIGLAAWLALIVTWLRRTPAWMVCVTLTLLVGAIFIDLVYAERPMALYWALLALAWNRADAGSLLGRHRRRSPIRLPLPATRTAPPIIGGSA